MLQSWVSHVQLKAAQFHGEALYRVSLDLHAAEGALVPVSEATCEASWRAFLCSNLVWAFQKYVFLKFRRRCDRFMWLAGWRFCFEAPGILRSPSSGYEALWNKFTGAEGHSWGLRSVRVWGAGAACSRIAIAQIHTDLLDARFVDVQRLTRR